MLLNNPLVLNQSESRNKSKLLFLEDLQSGNFNAESYVQDHLIKNYWSTNSNVISSEFDPVTCQALGLIVLSKYAPASIFAMQDIRFVRYTDLLEDIEV